jgi:methylated-DNA-[protein]-cysteine S-methyltransferase
MIKLSISPIGTIQISGTESHITSIRFVDENSVGVTLSHPDTATTENWQLCNEAQTQLEEYFSGKRTVFDLPLQPQGTDFQQAVWKALQQIPFGETRSYGDIAQAIGKPKASRAIGQANNKNPIAIVIPCHRVIGSNHQLTGYAGGLWRKEFLLDLEQKKESK